MATLAKGLAVLGCFGKQRPAMTLSEAALAANVSRATARRILRTLAELGYVEQHGRQFSLSPNILQLGFAYLATQSWIDRAVPLMKDLSERVRESCSAAILQGTEIVYVARVPTKRIMSVAASVGSRLPAFHTAMGRVQLGFLDAAEIWRRLKSRPHRADDAEHHHRPAGAVRAHPRRSRAGVLDRGRGARARPARDRRSDRGSPEARSSAALNLSTHSTRTTRNEMRDRFLPELRAVAAQIAPFVT